MSRGYIPVDIRQIVILRAKHRCEYCHSPADYSPEIFEIEHVRPISAGGTTVLSNLALACPGCNRYKGAKLMITDVETQQSISLFNPRLQSWEEHFAWSQDFTTIEGVTTIGQVTINTLKMNRQTVQHFRAALYAIGLHPGQQQH